MSEGTNGYAARIEALQKDVEILRNSQREESIRQDSKNGDLHERINSGQKTNYTALSLIFLVLSTIFSGALWFISSDIADNKMVLQNMTQEVNRRSEVIGAYSTQKDSHQRWLTGLSADLKGLQILVSNIEARVINNEKDLTLNEQRVQSEEARNGVIESKLDSTIGRVNAMERQVQDIDDNGTRALLRGAGSK